MGPVGLTSTCVQGMRTVIAGQSEPTQEQIEEGRQHNETWTWYPDDMPLRSLYGGDSRAALVSARSSFLLRADRQKQSVATA